MQDYLSVQFLIYQIAARFSAASTASYKEHGLNLFGVRVLVYLGRHSAATVGELSKATSIDQPTLSHLLKRMAADKLVTKRRQRHDNRTVQVRLTPEGQQIAERCMALTAEHEKRLLSSLSTEEVETLKGMLERIFESIDDDSRNLKVPLQLDDE
ncbi:MAG: MarR family transcriptional regulator [Mesorhizobium sp.]